MHKYHSKIEIYLPLLTVFTDAAVIFISYLLSYYIRFDSHFTFIFPVEKGVPGIGGYLFFALATLPVWILVFHNFKLYRLNRAVFIFDEFFVIAKSTTISIILSIGIIFFFRDFPYSRIVFVLIWIVSSVLLTISRYFLLKLEKTFYNKGIGVKNVCIVGTNEMAHKIYTKISKDKFTGYNVLGFFSSNPPDPVFAENKVYLGNYDDVPRKIRELGIHKFFVSIGYGEQEDFYNLIKKCEGINVEFMLAPDYLDLVTSRLKIIEVDGIPFMRIKSLPLNAWSRIIKRTFDIVVSILMLIAFSPLILVLSVAIKLTSKGPLFYKQERVGLDGKKFMMLKFRSMRVDAEADGTPRFVSADDQRRTPIGKFLRKYSLDEIPQLINVLKGEMSIVGPRPEREYFINILQNSIHKYLERHRVKGGMTGWAQVNGYRGPDTSIQTRIDYDIYYIENWSLIFDLKIIFKTVKEIFFSKSAQ